MCSSPLYRSNQHTRAVEEKLRRVRNMREAPIHWDESMTLQIQHQPKAKWIFTIYRMAFGFRSLISWSFPLPPFSPAIEFHSDCNLKCFARCIHHGCGWRCSGEKERCLAIRAFLAKHTSPPFHSPSAHHIYHLCSEHITNSLNCALLSTTHRMARAEKPGVIATQSNN